MQPGLKLIKHKQKFLSSFKGLCLRRITPEGYFRDAENISSDGYPTITPRKARTIITESSDVHAMHAHAKMCWLWGRMLFYGDDMVGELTEGEKQFASLGANIVIFPDKKLLDTQNLTLSSLDNETSASQIQLTPCNQDGTPGQSTNYTKLEAEGIGQGFKEGDGVSISGLGDTLPDGNYLLQGAGENHLIIIHALDEGASVSGEIKISRKSPDLDFICALDNRIWGASSLDHKICACKLGDPTNWEVFQGISTDAYQAIVPSPAPFTGCSSDLGSIVFFKEEEIIRLFGNKPSNFQLTSYKMPGVESGSSKSIAYLESAILYKGLTGVYVYDGSIPQSISAFLGDKRYTGARAGSVNGKYFISMLDESENEYRLFVYDTKTGAWYKENAPEIKYFTRYGNELYMCASDGKMYTVNGGKLWYDKNSVISTRIVLSEQQINWHFETGPLSLSMPNRQYATSLHLRYFLKKGASFTAQIKFFEKADYVNIASFTQETEENTLTIPIPVQRSDSAILRFFGTGDATIISIGLTYEEGSNR